MAQLILESIENPECVLLETLTGTTRGNQGFGSTGTSVNLASSTDLGCGNPMIIPIAIRIDKKEPWKPAAAMIDSGTSTQFINPDFASQLGLKLDPKSIPESLIVVEGRKATPRTHTCTLDMLIDQHVETLTFQVTKLAGWQMILGKDRKSVV